MVEIFDAILIALEHFDVEVKATDMPFILGLSRKLRRVLVNIEESIGHDPLTYAVEMSDILEVLDATDIVAFAGDPIAIQHWAKMRKLKENKNE